MTEPTIDEMIEWVEVAWNPTAREEVRKAIRAILEREKKRVEDKTIGEFKYLGIAIDRRDD